MLEMTLIAIMQLSSENRNRIDIFITLKQTFQCYSMLDAPNSLLN